jgi:hypothetical protein
MSHTIKLNEDLGAIVLRAKGSMNVTEITEALDELMLSGVFHSSVLGFEAADSCRGLKSSAATLLAP